MQPPSIDSVPTLIRRLESILEPVDPATLIPGTGPLELELGSGDGSFLVAWAAANPTTRLLGVERLLGRLRKTDRKARRSRLENLRLIRIEAAYFLRYLVPPRALDAIHLYFPDPWPKRKHHRHRLVQEPFAQRVAEVLRPAGVIHLRTDDADYFEQMLTVFNANPLFTPVPTPERLAAVQTDFERGFAARGIPARRASYQLKT